MGWTALHEASFHNHQDVVKVLLVYGADATKKNKQGAWMGGRGYRLM